MCKNIAFTLWVGEIFETVSSSYSVARKRSSETKAIYSKIEQLVQWVEARRACLLFAFPNHFDFSFISVHFLFIDILTL